MKCSNCGAKVEKDWVRCPKCMEYLSRTCPSCNEIIDINWKACPKCGSIFDNNNIIQEGYTEIPTENKTQIYSDTPIGANSNLTQTGVMSSDFPKPTTERAGFGIRFAAYMIDFLLLFGIFYIIDLIITLASSPYYDYSTPFVILILIAYWGYFIYFEGEKGWTPGKKLLKLKVVTEDGISPIGGKKAFLRTTLGRSLAGLFFGLGYLGIVTDKEGRQGLHDRVAGTYVIKTNL